MYISNTQWIIYLRKSRQDDPKQTVEEVLSKHETILQEYARREFGGDIPPENIYREVVSGESIDDRVEIKQVLARLEDPSIIGVLVVEPSRLSRGDLADCARIINAFRFSDTLVGTPMMTYNLKNKMERKFFQDELLRGNDYLEYTKEILYRGRVASVKRGCFIGRIAPYGYDRIIKNGDHTLEPNANADTVRLVFNLFANDGLTPLQIARRLDAAGIKPPMRDKWSKETLRGMLRNRHYIGQVYYAQQKTTSVLENGYIIKKRIYQPEEEMIIADGLHDAIIDMETWEKAQNRFSAPRTKDETELKNPLAGLLYCAGCGRLMRRRLYTKAEDRYTCQSKPICYKTPRISEIMDAVLYGLEHSELPNLRTKIRNGDGNARKIQERLIAKLEKQLEEYREQEENQYDLLETRQYTPEIFAKRNAQLRRKMEETEAAIYKARSELPKNVNFAEREVALLEAIQALKDPGMKPSEQNKILKSIVERISYKGPERGSAHASRGVTPFTLEFTLRF